MTSRKAISLPWLLAGVVVFLLLIALSWMGEQSGNRYTLFAGRFHPLILHLPIGALIAAFLLEALALAKPRLDLGAGVLTLLGITALTALPAALCGILLSWEGGYNEVLLGRHFWLGAITTSASFLLIALRLPAGRGRPSLSYGIVLGVSVFLLGLTGHYGGTLTHGEGYLSRHWPFSRAVAEEAATATLLPAESASLYEARIQPILENYCVQCHGPEKSKGDFRLDTYERMMASGEHAPVIAPGDSFASLLVEQLKLPLEHEHRMPPKGKRQPSSREIQLLSWWIDQGADPRATLDDLELTPRIARILDPEAELTEANSDEAAASAKHWNEIHPVVARISREHQLEILPLSASDHRLRVRSSVSSSRIDEPALAALESLAEQIVWLDASHAELGEQGMESIAKMTNLERLQISHTGVTDELLASLQALPKLNSLNLFGTRVTDAGLRALERLHSLRRVYLWQTQVTPEGVERLQAQLYDRALADELMRQQAEIAKRIESLEVIIDSGVTSEDPAAPEPR